MALKTSFLAAYWYWLVLVLVFENRAVDLDKLQGRGKDGERLVYALNEQTPYTGWVKQMWRNGQIRLLAQYKDGKKDGLGTEWCPNGQKKEEVTWKDRKQWTVVAWKPDGEKCPDTNVVDGNGVLVAYDDDGTETWRCTLKGGGPVHTTMAGRKRGATP